MRLILFLIPALLSAGQAIQLSSQVAFNNSIPGVCPGCAVDVEFQIHGWGGSPTTGAIAQSLAAVDLTMTVDGSGVLHVYSNHQTGWTGGDCAIPLIGNNLITARFQRIPLAGNASGRNHCTAVNETGALVTDFEMIYSGVSSTTVSNGIQLGGGTNIAWDFFRFYPTNVAINAKTPTTAQSHTGMAMQWMFDGSLSDSTGNGFTAAMSSGSPSYAATPFQTLTKAVIQAGASCPVPYWTLWTSMSTASSTNCLTAANSYTQSDGSDAVTVTWSNVSGPNTPTIGSTSAVTTTVAGTIFGYYVFGLAVNAVVGGGSDSTALGVGAVTMNSGGVVLPDDPRVNSIFNGPLIGFGQNPWGYEEERNKKAIDEQIANNPYYATQTTWKQVNASGTIAYQGSGIGPAPSTIPGATLNGVITATAATIAIHTAQNLPSLANLPTAILIGSGSREMVRICGASATTGNVTLTVCYDGRGIANTPWGVAPVIPAQVWGDNTPVGEMRVSGTGTQFISDSQRPLAPAGMGPIGPVTYSTGTLRMSASSGALVGTSTKWSQTFGILTATTGSTAVTSSVAFDTWYSGQVIYVLSVPYTLASASGTTGVLTTPYTGPNGGGQFNYGMYGADAGIDCNVHPTLCGYMIRVQATHAGGTPFIWWSGISSVNSNTSITALRDAPADIDTGTDFTYQILGPRFLSLEFADPIYGGTKRIVQNGQYCESETGCFATPEHDIAVLNGLQASGAKYSYKNVIGCCSPFGPNFYGTGLAARNFYFRSGYGPALTLANQIDDYWARDPEVGSGLAAGSKFLTGGSVMGAIADVVLNPSSLTLWSDVRGWAQQGADFISTHNTFTNGAAACNSTGGNDLRDSSYIQNPLVQVAAYDPDDNYRTKWALALGFGNGSGTGYQPVSGASSVYVLLGGVSITPGIGIAGDGIPTGTTVTSLGGNVATGTVSAVNGNNTVTWVEGDHFPAFQAGTWVSIGGAYQVVSNTSTSMVISPPFSGTTSPNVVFYYGTIVNISNPTTMAIPYESIAFITRSKLPRDLLCARTDYSFAIPNMGDPVDGGPPGLIPRIDLTANSPNATAHTGTASLAGVCQGAASGTITVTNGSASAMLATGSLGNNSTNFNIVIWDTTSTPNKVGFLQFIFTGSSVTLASPWPFASGTFSFVVNAQAGAIGGSVLAIGNRDYTDADNVRQQEGWACTAVDTTHITLNRPWDNAVTGGSFHLGGTYSILNGNIYGSPPAGFYTQPYMYGILELELGINRYLPQLPTLDYSTLLANTGSWFINNAYDPNTQGVYYTSVQGTCEPSGSFSANSATKFQSIHGLAGTPCDYSGLVGQQDSGGFNGIPASIVPPPQVSEYTSRASMAEGANAEIEYYKAQCAIDTTHCDAARTVVDNAYGAMWGNQFLTTGGLYADSHYLNVYSEASDVFLGGTKWTGFFFGIGMFANSWPALRQKTPTVIMDWPQQGGTFGAIGTMYGKAIAYSATVSNIEISTDGGAFTTAGLYGFTIGVPSTGWSYQLYADLLSPGSHTFAIRVTDSLGAQTVQTTTASRYVRTQICSHTLITSAVYCERAAVNTATNTASISFAGGYTAGQLIVVSTGGCCEGVTATAAQITNTNGYTWICPAGDASSIYSDSNIVHNLMCYAFVPSNTTTTDVITSTFPSYATTANLYVVVYSGLTSFEPGASWGLAAWGPFGAVAGPYAVTPGDLNVVFSWGAPYTQPYGYNERIEDGSRPLGIVSDQIVTGTTAIAQWAMNPEGYTGMSLAFIPSGGPPPTTSGATLAGPQMIAGPSTLK